MKIISPIVLCLFLTITPRLWAHCEVPCGIYDDELRYQLILEHITTMEKAMKQIQELSKDPSKNANQIARWVFNKETHATELQHIVTQYFMTQRIKLDAEKYDQKIGALHQLLIYSMKCKQTTDAQFIAKCRESAKAFKALYFTHTH